MASVPQTSQSNAKKVGSTTNNGGIARHSKNMRSFDINHQQPQTAQGVKFQMAANSPNYISQTGGYSGKGVGNSSYVGKHKSSSLNNPAKTSKEAPPSTGAPPQSKHGSRVAGGQSIILNKGIRIGEHQL